MHKKEKLSAVLQTKMKEKHISKAELARLIDVSDTTIHRYLNDVMKPRPLLLKRLMKVLDFAYSDFY